MHQSQQIAIVNSLAAMNLRQTRKERTVPQDLSIDVLHDDVLLVVFDFYVACERYQRSKRVTEAWQSLVHVCRRWRSLVFESPRRLNIRLVCEPGMPAMKRLNIWPALPLIISGSTSSTSMDNRDIVDALGHNDRVCQIDLRITWWSSWDEVLAAMEVPFPALTELRLLHKVDHAPVISDTFLGGSAPLLQYLHMASIQFPGILKLLLSCTHLIELDLSGISYSGYFSPEALAACLSVTTSLNILSLKFLSSTKVTESRHPPPMTRCTLPNLNRFTFKGTSDYLEDLVARIDAPRLNWLSITFLDEKNFDTPHLVQFIGCMLRFERPIRADVVLYPEGQTSTVQLLRPSDNNEKVWVDISCEGSDSLVPSIAEVCAKCFPPLTTVETLRLRFYSIYPSYPKSAWDGDVENDEWLKLLRPFTAVKSLYLTNDIQPDLVSPLQQLVGGRTMEVLPSLQNIFLEYFKLCQPFKKAIRQFRAARWRSGHLIAVLPSQDW